MAGVSVRRRETKSGPRFQVRYGLGGRAYAVEQGGSFKTLREAKVRRDLIGGELAAGRNPAELLRAMLDQRPARTFAAWAEASCSSRVDYATETTKNMNSHIKSMAVFDDRDPATISISDVQEWIANLDLKPGSVRRHLATLRAILDFAGVDPNPARDRRVKLPARGKRSS
jgi:hypothetical protein